MQNRSGASAQMRSRFHKKMEPQYYHSIIFHAPPGRERIDRQMPAYYDEKTKSWYCKFYYTDYTGTKKQKKKRGFKLQREAKEYERSFLEHLQGTPDMTFQALYDIYIEDISHRLRKNTVDGKKNVFKNRILPYFKDRPINEIQATDIRAWQNEQIAAGYSNAYLDRIMNMIVTIFNYAVTFYNLPVNPCTKAGHMGKRTRSLNFWTLDEYNAIMEHVTDPAAHIAIELLFYSGMRFGELLALTPADLDYEKQTISIAKSLQRKNRQNYITAPKTDNGIRVITMPAAVMEHLEDYTKKLYGLQQDDLIFTFTRSLIRNNMKRACTASGISCIRIHDLRHSHVSLLIDLKFTPLLIAERIGDTVQMVNNTYGHLYPSRRQEVADRLNQLIVK